MVACSCGAIPIFVEGISRVDYDGDYRVLHLAVVLVVVVAACFGLGAGEDWDGPPDTAPIIQRRYVADWEDEK